MRIAPAQGSIRKWRHAPATGTNPTLTLAPRSTDDTPVIDGIYCTPGSSTNLPATLSITSTHASTTLGYSAPFAAGIHKQGEQFVFPDGLYLAHPPTSTAVPREVSLVVTLALGSTLDAAVLSILGR